MIPDSHEPARTSLGTLKVRIAVATAKRIRGLAYWLISDNRINGKARRVQPIQVMGKGRVEVEDGVQFGYFPSPYWGTTAGYLEARGASAAIRIGRGTVISNNSCIIAERAEITIGRNCVIGANLAIFDSDFHAVDAEARRHGDPAVAESVVVEDNAFIGQGVTILKGVRVGQGASIAAGSVVTSDVPPGAVAGGVPARILRAGEFD